MRYQVRCERQKRDREWGYWSRGLLLDMSSQVISEHLAECRTSVQKLEDRQQYHTSLDWSVKTISDRCTKVQRETHWFLNSSRGGSTGFAASARSGRNAESNDPNVDVSEGGESSDIL